MGRSSRPPLPSNEADDTSLRYAWVVLLVLPGWLLFYRSPDPASVPAVTLWSLYGIVVGVEGFRTWTLRHRPSARLHDLFPLFDAVAISLAVRWTGGIDSELWLLYPFQLVAGSFDPRIRTIRALSVLVLLSYALAVLPDVGGNDWARFFHHLHAPLASGTFSVRAGPGGYDAIARLLTRFFFLYLVGAMARARSQRQRRQEREVADLREQVAVSEDRARIARELQDSLNQTLVGSLLRLELCSRLIARDPGEAGQILDEEKTAIRAGLNSIRDFVFHLRPAELENEPFDRLLFQYAERFQIRTGIRVETTIEPMAEPKPAVRLAALRVIQESMTNTIKHAEASRILLSAGKDREGALVIRVEDDGRGFERETRKGGMGLSGMRERAESLGGSLELVSSPGQGTKVFLRLPLA